MEEVFKYIIGLGAAVMMPIIFTILGVCIGIKLPKALKSGLLVGVGFRWFISSDGIAQPAVWVRH